ncbi:MAG: hypothetical protein ACTHMQ_03460 [Protaetiibacter sp.]
MTASPRPLLPRGFVRALASAAALAAAAVVLAACAPDPGMSDPISRPTASETPDDPGDGGSPEPSSTPSGASHGAGMEGDLADAISSGNTAPIEDYLTEPTRVVIAASEADMQYSAVDAVLALDYVQPGVGTWDFELGPDVVDGYAASEYYGDFFPDDAIVGRSDSGAVVSFVPNGDRIGTIFMAIDESLITG